MEPVVVYRTFNIADAHVVRASLESAGFHPEVINEIASLTMEGYSMAGGGVRGGIAFGATDELGMHAVENPVHVHDLHATILHLLGLNHEKLTYKYAGRDFRLTDVYGQVVKGVIA
jgi:hypothetical protein